ncbi:C1 family peptidase [Legionella shakespearei]|uniref:Cysteine protease n=1 Tax=Legionella shakespearei DSM 23087 TaxID=1122169 RepID=A0A0W0Z668_9GAMM|nr:C1 family peptidase [Legionella shakespearei]KTD64605.1 cysteine protease [Legionella shakespearei DSM 23087]
MLTILGKWTAVSGALILSAQLYAGAVEIIGNIPIVIEYDDEDYSPIKKEQHKVIVQQLRLSPAAKKVLAKRVEDSALLESDLFHDTKVEPYVNLGMNGTPALDQGVHGSCVTFATTAALDAIIGKGDYISQLCSLSLGSYLYRHKMTDNSGWDGTFGPDVLKQYQHYGLVTKKYQYDEGCAGVKRYPTNTEGKTGKLMSINEYTANSFPLEHYATWEHLVELEQSFSKNHNPAALLRAVRKHLREGNRIVFGALIDVDQKYAGALGSYQKAHDSWILTKEITNRIKRGDLSGGHQMLIIGYDDQAVVVDAQGKVHKGLLIIRNSWGPRAGHSGNFYMSYNYFKTLCDEAQVIIPIN